MLRYLFRGPTSSGQCGRWNQSEVFAALAEAGMAEAEELREVRFREFEDRIRFMS